MSADECSAVDPTAELLEMKESGMACCMQERAAGRTQVNLLSAHSCTYDIKAAPCWTASVIKLFQKESFGNQ